jgi:hypothetical protein
MSNRGGQADVHQELARVYRDVGDPASSCEHLATAAALWTEMGNTRLAQATRDALAELDQVVTRAAGTPSARVRPARRE